MLPSGSSSSSPPDTCHNLTNEDDYVWVELLQVVEEEEVFHKVIGGLIKRNEKIVKLWKFHLSSSCKIVVVILFDSSGFTTNCSFWNICPQLHLPSKSCDVEGKCFCDYNFIKLFCLGKIHLSSSCKKVVCILNFTCLYMKTCLASTSPGLNVARRWAQTFLLFKLFKRIQII